MEEIDVLLNSDFSVTSPNFGDGEIRSIGFSNPDIELRLSESRDSKLLSIEMLGAEFFRFETDHPQNVIDQLYIYPDRAAYMASNPKAAVLPEPQYSEMLPRKVVVIHPVAGPEIICLCREVKICAV